MADLKNILRDLIKEKNAAKEKDETERKRRADDERNSLLSNVGGDLAKSLEPTLAKLAESAQISEASLRKALTEAIQINTPGVDTESISNAIREAISGLQFPEPRVEVKIPETKFPEIKIPETKFPDRMSVGLENFSRQSPMPVMMVDTKGEPFVFSFPAGGGGGKSDHFTVKGITQTVGMVAINPDGSPAGAGSVASSVSVSDIFSTVGANVVNPDGRIKVELPTGASGLTDTELRATAVPVSQLSGASWSTAASIVAVTDIFSTSATSSVVNPDNRVKVELPTGSSGLTDTELRATAVPVSQLSGASWSTSVFDVFQTTVTSTVVNADNRVKVELPAQTVTVSSVTATVAAMNVDSTGVGYSGSNPLPITVVSGALTSTIVVGSVVADAVDDGSAPVQGGGIARTANPTAVAANDVVKSTHDDLGRQVMRPLQVRDLIQTAYVSVANGTETTLLAASAGSFHDLIMVVGSNASDAAVSLDIRAVSGGNIINTLRIPANGTAGWTPPVPWPQDATGNNWTVDGPDETGRTITVSALFSREV